MAKVPQIVDGYTDFTLGNLQKTENKLDFALSKENLFFAVETPEGVRLTRDGSFTLDDEGFLVNKQGHKVLPSDYFETEGYIKFDPQDTIVEADKNGKLYSALTGSLKMIEKKNILVLEPENVDKLVKEGNSLFRPDESSELKALTQTNSVRQGFVEKSNVNPITEMVAMIETNRLVGMYQKAMDTQMNDLNRDAIEKIAVSR